MVRFPPPAPPYLVGLQRVPTILVFPSESGKHANRSKFVVDCTLSMLNFRNFLAQEFDSPQPPHSRNIGVTCDNA